MLRPLDDLAAGLCAALQVFAAELPTTRQRRLVAARELLVAAAERSGAVLLADHVDQDSSETLAMIDGVARLSRGHDAAVVVAGRPHARPAGWSAAASDLLEALDLPGDVSDALRQVARSVPDAAGYRFADPIGRPVTALWWAAGWSTPSNRRRFRKTSALCLEPGAPPVGRRNDRREGGQGTRRRSRLPGARTRRWPARRPAIGRGDGVSRRRPRWSPAPGW